MLPEDLTKFLSVATNRTLEFEDGEIRKVILYSERDIPKRQFDVARYAVDPSCDDIEDREWFDGYDLV